MAGERCGECGRPIDGSGRDTSCDYTGSYDCRAVACDRYRARARAAEGVLRIEAAAIIEWRRIRDEDEPHRTRRVIDAENVWADASTARAKFAASLASAPADTTAEGE